MFQYNRICDAATRYRSVAVNSHPSAMLAEIRILVFTFCLLHSGFLYLAFIPSEVFFRQVAFVGVEAVIPHDAEIAQGNVLQQPGKELTVMQRQFLTYCITCSGICMGGSRCTIQSFLFATLLMKPINSMRS